MFAAFLLMLLQDPAPVLQQEIVVTAEREEQPLDRSTAAVTLLSREEIERAPVETLAELIARAPGVHVLFANPTAGTPMVLSRGFFGGGEVEYVRLLVDGVPVYDVESGLIDWRSMRTSEIDRVEVVRGPGSANWGDTALGGVIQVFTQQAGAFPGRIGASLGTEQTWSAEAGYVFNAHKISGSAASTDGWRDHAAGRELAAQFSTSGRGWGFTLAGSNRDRQEPGALPLDAANDDPRRSDPMFAQDRDETTRLRAGWTMEENRGWSAGVHGSMRDSDATRTLLILAGIGDRLDRSLRTHSLGGSVEMRRGWFHAGIEGARDGLETSYSREVRVAGGSASRWRLAGFALAAAEISPRLRLTGGIRADRIADEFDGVEQNHTAWSPRLGLNYQQGTLSAFAQVSRAFKAPTLDQQFDPRPIPDFAGGSFTISNPDLSPQNADNIEAGVVRHTASSRMELVAYRTAVDDEIDFDPITFRYANIGSTLHTGIELDASLPPRHGFEPRLRYALTRVTPSEGPNEGNQLKNIPRHLLRAGGSLSLSRIVNADLMVNWIGERFLDDDNSLIMDDAVTVDVRLMREIGNGRIRLDLFNLTGEDYFEVGLVLPSLEGALVPYVYPAAGFSARAGIDWRF